MPLRMTYYSMNYFSRYTLTVDCLLSSDSFTGVSLPGDRVIDGASMLPLFQGQTVAPPHEFMFHYCGSVLHAVRYIPKEGK